MTHVPDPPECSVIEDVLMLREPCEPWQVVTEMSDLIEAVKDGSTLCIDTDGSSPFLLRLSNCAVVRVSALDEFIATLAVSVKIYPVVVITRFPRVPEAAVRAVVEAVVCGEARVVMRVTCGRDLKILKGYFF